MTHLRRVVLPLRILLAIVFAALLAAQIWAVPALLPDLAEPTLERSFMRWTMGAVAVLGLLCVQAVIVCTWKLLTLVTRRPDLQRGRDAVGERHRAGDRRRAGRCSSATFVCAYYFIIDEVSDDPVLPALLLLLLLVGAVLGLLMVIMRALLRQATTLRADMEAVI